jgi:hypothetical protein
MNSYIKIRCAAIILIAAGYGWAGGHYIPANSNIFAYLFQFIVLGILLLLATTFFSIPENKRYNPHWSIKGLTIFSIVSFLINVANIIHGAFNSNRSTFGSHNSFADLIPIALLLCGSGLWLVTVFIKETIKLSDK